MYHENRHKKKSSVFDLENGIDILWWNVELGFPGNPFLDLLSKCIVMY